jgi:hypothetical protein
MTIKPGPPKLITPITPRARHDNAASGISPDFGITRAGGLSGPEDSVAIFRERVFVLTDEHGGRKLHEATTDGPVVVAGTGDWLHSLHSERMLTAWEGSPTSDDLIVRGFDGATWHAGAGRSPAGMGDRAGLILDHPTMPLSFHARRKAPGMSACQIYDRREGRAIARWLAPLTGRPAWTHDRLWLLYEAWPRQRLVAISADAFDVIEEHLLPIGRLSSLVVTAAQTAAIWADPWTPASLVVAASPAHLLTRIRNHADLAAAGGNCPYAVGVDPLPGAPAVVYDPLGQPFGTLIMLHGGPHSLIWPAFSPLVAFLCRSGWRVVTPNVSSSAMGSRPAPSKCRLGIDDALDVVRLASEYAGGGSVVVGGWSYGAYVAARAVALGARCTGLVSLSGFLSPETISTSGDGAVAAFRRAYQLPATPSRDLAGVAVLAVHGGHDGRVPIERHRSYVNGLPRHLFVELPDDGHGIATDTGAAVAYPALGSWLASL